MKKSTFIIALFASLLLFVSVSCKKDLPYMTEASIIGYDYRSCVCCGGVMIQFNNETDFRLISNDTDLGISESESFPIAVKVDWKVDTANVCDRIIITRLTRL